MQHPSQQHTLRVVSHVVGNSSIINVICMKSIRVSEWKEFNISLITKWIILELSEKYHTYTHTYQSINQSKFIFWAMTINNNNTYAKLHHHHQIIQRQIRMITFSVTGCWQLQSMLRYAASFLDASVKFALRVCGWHRTKFMYVLVKFSSAFRTVSSTHRLMSKLSLSSHGSYN